MPEEFSASAYSYELPPELIAQKPAERGEDSRLLVLDRQTGKLTHTYFRNILDHLDEKDLLVFNDTRVIPARLLGIKAGGSAQCEVFLLKQLTAKRWEALVKPGKRLPPDSVVEFGSDFSAKVLDILSDGRRIVEFIFAGDFFILLNYYGQTPLPPYINASTTLDDREKTELASRYQTVYARESGAAAAPTAGLHFSGELLAQIKARGVSTAFITLHVGLGTFLPIKTADIREHQIHTEEYFLPAETVRAIQACRQRGGRVIAVGTTVVRVLETIGAGALGGAGTPIHGQTNIYIYPGYKFQVIDTLITNFHLPESTLLVLVSALAGREKILAAYQEAIKQKYRFFSFGDAMLVI